jgi:hypothetical protein
VPDELELHQPIFVFSPSNKYCCPLFSSSRALQLQSLTLVPLPSLTPSYTPRPLIFAIMSTLAAARYGKDNVRVYKVHRDEKTGVQTVVEMTVCVLLEGEIDIS